MVQGYNRRKSIRFKADPDAYAQIDFDMKGEFKPQLTGLIYEESAKGCGLIVMDYGALLVGDICMVKVGKLSPMKAEVRWRQEIDDRVFKIGLMYLE